jgi:hypothetical protein
MEANKSEIDDIIDPTRSAPLPRPIPARECACDCGHSFYPRRRDNIYLNKQHADYGYNHGVRKANSQNRKNVEKILLKNDQVLDKHYKSEVGQYEIVRFFHILKADGFNFDYNIGKSENDGVDIYYTYNYSFYMFIQSNIRMVKIDKR